MSRQVLLVGPAWVGDMVMAQVLCKVLKQRDPTADIDILAPAWTQALSVFMPEVRSGITSPFGHGDIALKRRYQLGKALREKRYDQAIVLPNSFKAALIPAFAKIPVRTGFRGEMRYGLLNDIRPLDKERYPKLIEHFAWLGMNISDKNLPALSMPSFMVNPELLAQTLKRHSFEKKKPIIALCPGAEYGPAKRWPPHFFAQTALHYHQQGFDIALFGSKKDEPFGDVIMKALPSSYNFIGKTSLVDAVALLSLAEGVITNDSGLMHVACALKRPTVAIYGSSSPLFTPPLGERVKIVTLNLSCSPCFERECPLGHLNCLKQLTPDLVIQAGKDLFG